MSTVRNSTPILLNSNPKLPSRKTSYLVVRLIIQIEMLALFAITYDRSVALALFSAFFAAANVMSLAARFLPYRSGASR